MAKQRQRLDELAEARGASDFCGPFGWEGHNVGTVAMETVVETGETGEAVETKLEDDKQLPLNR
jgi:hypothetical protein